jgi:class 3 adenylate cyclase/tetratricopeptide (TPR) repeat protein
MSPTLEDQIKQLQDTIATMEDQRDSLGDTVVDRSLAPLQEKLDELLALLESRQEPLIDAPAQQRKLVTLLFMDVVGSTSAIAAHLDPEDTLEIMDKALKRLAVPVEDHGGHVTRFMGDGFKAVFGAPIAQENDPEQAVRAGLYILETAMTIAGELAEQWDIEGFQVRVGVNTGLVALGGLTEAADTVMGKAVNLAARLESAAPAGGLLVSHDTYRHIRGVFDVEPWEPILVKGFDEAISIYHILRARPRAFRLYTRGVEGVETRMIGRQTEFKYLQDTLLNAIEEGEGSTVTITGEAGVGKSRLLYEFQNWIELLSDIVRFYEGRGRQGAQGLPYGLLRDLFEFRFQIQDNDVGQVVREKIETGFGEIFGESDEGWMRTHILGQWLGFDFSTSPHLRGVLNDPKQLRNRGLIYLGEYFTVLSELEPVIIFLEDIHWADDSSLDTLNWLGERLHRQKVLIVCAARGSLFERRPYWGEGLPYHRRLQLETLSSRESRQLVGEILRYANQVPDKLRELVVEGSEGNPFYLEELIKMLVEDGVIVIGEEIWHIEPEHLSKVKVPPTLAGVLQARLDGLPPEERLVLQQASVVGRLFWDRIVTYIQTAENGEEEKVPEALTTLRQRELIYRREASAFVGAREYIFKHDILRDVTYESVLKSLRRRYHGLVADWLISHGSERIAEYSGSIAEHLFLANRQEQAGMYLLQAGEAALASYANDEAVCYLSRALELSLSDVQEAPCLTSLGEAQSRLGRREEAIQAFRQGIDLYLKLEDSDKVADLYARLSFISWRVDYQKAWNVCQEGLSRLEGAPNSPGLARLLAEAGRTGLFQSKPDDEVIALCERAIEMAERTGALAVNADARVTIGMLLNEDEAIKQWLEVADFSEINELWPQAIRAHICLGMVYGNLNLDTAVQHDFQAVNISLNIGDKEALFLILGNLGGKLVELGHLNTLESKLNEYFHRSTANESAKQEFIDNWLTRLSYWNGEWIPHLEYCRYRLNEYRLGRSIQIIANYNIDLVDVCLELNRFKSMTDIEEAEAGLHENIEINWHVIPSNYLLVIVFSRQNRITEAHQRLAEVINELDRTISGPNEVYKLRAETELARAEGRWDDAISTCKSLIEIYQESHHNWQHARQLIDLGDAYLGRNDPGDKELAEKAFQQSLDMFTEMPAPGYVKILEERIQAINAENTGSNLSD